MPHSSASNHHHGKRDNRPQGPSTGKVRISADPEALQWQGIGIVVGVRRTFRGHRDSVLASSYNHNGKQLASGGADGVVMIWNFTDSMRAFRFGGHKVCICRCVRGLPPTLAGMGAAVTAGFVGETPCGVPTAGGLTASAAARVHSALFRDLCWMWHSRQMGQFLRRPARTARCACGLPAYGPTTAC